MSFYHGLFLVTGWLFALLLIVGQVTFYDDGHVGAETRLAGVALLLFWAYSAFRTANPRDRGFY